MRALGLADPSSGHFMTHFYAWLSMAPPLNTPRGIAPAHIALLLLVGATVAACSEVRWPVLDAQRELEAAKAAVIALRSLIPPPPPSRVRDGPDAGTVWADQTEGQAFQLSVSADRLPSCPVRAYVLAEPAGGLTHAQDSLWRIAGGVPTRVPADSWLAAGLRRGDSERVRLLCWTANRMGFDIDNAAGRYTVLLESNQDGGIQPLDVEQMEIR